MTRRPTASRYARAALAVGPEPATSASSVSFGGASFSRSARAFGSSRSAAWSQVSSLKIGFGGGPFAPFGAPTGRAAKYMNPSTIAGSMQSSGMPYVDMLSRNPRMNAGTMNAPSQREIGRDMCVDSRSQDPGPGGWKFPVYAIFPPSPMLRPEGGEGSGKSAADQLIDDAQHRVEADRLLEHDGRLARCVAGEGGGARHEQHRYLLQPRIALHLRHQRRTLHHRHDDVGDDEIGDEAVVAHRRERLAAIGR